MSNLENMVERILEVQQNTDKPLAIILAGHNGSGKSTMWRKTLSDRLKIPLINADRMMLSILPEADGNGALTDWATDLRDNNQDWMRVSQQGVEAFVAHAMSAKVPFAMETVFSFWKQNPDGTVSTKITLIHQLQDAGYFVLLFFVGLTNADLSALRVLTRVQQNGHDVERAKLVSRFPRTQLAIRHALDIADGAILVDNSRDQKFAFTVCQVRLKQEIIFDIRNGNGVNIQVTPAAITSWMDTVCPKGK